MAVERNRSEKSQNQNRKNNDRAVQKGNGRGSAARDLSPAERRAQPPRQQKQMLPDEADRDLPEILLGENSSDLSAAFEGKRKKNYKPKVRTVRARTKSRLPVSSVFFMVVCTLLIMFMIINYVQINEYTQEVASLKQEMSALESERTDLELELEKKNDLSTIEEEARKLRMMGSEDLRKVVVHSKKEDTVESYETEEEDYGIIATVMSALGQNIRTYWNIFSPGE